jgi:hypothetical protein
MRDLSVGEWFMIAFIVALIAVGVYVALYV